MSQASNTCRQTLADALEKYDAAHQERAYPHGLKGVAQRNGDHLLREAATQELVSAVRAYLTQPQPSSSAGEVLSKRKREAFEKYGLIFLTNGRPAHSARCSRAWAQRAKIRADDYDPDAGIANECLDVVCDCGTDGSYAQFLEDALAAQQQPTPLPLKADDGPDAVTIITAAIDTLHKLGHVPLSEDLQLALSELRFLRLAVGHKGKFRWGAAARKKGSKGQWHGRVCGFYSTLITPEGYAVESVFEPGSVQIYPASALEAWQPPVPERDQPTEAELNAVRGYLMDIRGGPHTVGNMRHFANRYEHSDASDLPESWKDLPDEAHVTKAMHAEVLWRAFRRAALATAEEANV